MTLEEVIKQRLAEAQKQVVLESKKEDKEPVKAVEPEQVGAEEEVDTNPKLKSKTLTKESLDAMSEEEIAQIDEEQLDELSKDTLKSYVGKARDSQKDSSEKQDKAYWAGDKKEVVKQSGNIFNRGTNIIRAKEKIDSKEKTGANESVSDQVSALLEAEGLSEEFKEQAVTIFEAAVTDRVLQIKEELQKEFESQLSEAKVEMEDDIDGFLSEAILQWKAENEVAIKSNFKSQLAESFIDGMKALIAEHNIEVPEGQEDALEVALKEVEKLNEQFSGKDQEIGSLQEQINQLKAEKILESFKSKMTVTEFDRFSQLTESVKFKDEEQYEKQLNVVLENFGSTKKETKPVVTESVITEQIADVKIVTESNSKVNAYANFLSKKR